MASPPTKPSYYDLVFINCPFDDAYIPILRAIIYTIYRCGFWPVSAMADDNALENRVDKLFRMIERCRYGIHDISRTEANANNLPRFNMPFELGIFYGASKYGNKIQKKKNAVILERTRYQYQQYLSDINGVDTKAHENDPIIAIRLIRNWLAAASKRTTIPPAPTIIANYNSFVQKLPQIAETLGYPNTSEIPFNDFCQIVEEAIRSMLQVS